jgi:competence protein ComEC
MWVRALESEAHDARPSEARQSSFAASSLEVCMFSVGEGEAILVVFPDRRTWLIDGGTSNTAGLNAKLGGLLVGYLEAHGLTLEVCVPSHPHVDHVGSLATILTSGSQALAPVVTIYRADTAWTGDAAWLRRYREAVSNSGGAVREELISGTHREVPISDGVRAHLFAGLGAGAYTSLFMQLRFHTAKLLFTGDSQCGYELKLLEQFGEADLQADMLKITHHGSSSGTARRFVDAVRPAFAIASTADEDGHRLEADTLERVLAVDGHRRVYETLVDGDIIIRTDGQSYRDGILYQIDFTAPGEFASQLGAKLVAADQIQRGRSDIQACQ